MAYIREINGLISYNVEGGYIKNFSGQFLFIIETDCLREWSSRQIKYKFVGNYIQDFYGRTLYEVRNGQIKDFYGRLLFTYDHDYIRDITGRFVYRLDGPLTNAEFMSFVAIMQK